jgi:hypothetical protein
VKCPRCGSELRPFQLFGWSEWACSCECDPLTVRAPSEQAAAESYVRLSEAETPYPKKRRKTKQ